MFEQKAESKAMTLLHAEKKVRGINLDTEMALRCKLVTNEPKHSQGNFLSLSFSLCSFFPLEFSFIFKQEIKH